MDVWTGWMECFCSRKESAYSPVFAVLFVAGAFGLRWSSRENKKTKSEFVHYYFTAAAAVFFFSFLLER